MNMNYTFFRNSVLMASQVFLTIIIIIQMVGALIIVYFECLFFCIHSIKVKNMTYIYILVWQSQNI